MQPLAVIQTKLCPPAIKDSVIRRAKLYQKFNKITDYPITVVSAGAGYGKSTALSLFIHDVKLKTCWYSLSSHDDDFLPFLVYLIHSIQMKFPQFGHSLQQQIHSRNYFHEKQILSLSSLFINEIVALDEEVTVILDDFHHVEKSNDIQEFIENVLEYIPSNLHLVIVSRCHLKWIKLTKLKVTGMCLEVRPQDFVLTRDEVELLLCDMYDLSLSEESIDEVVQMTEGWAMAVALIGKKLQDEKNTDFFRQNPVLVLQDLYEYIHLESFCKQSLDMQQFLEQTSILDEMSIETCSFISNIEGIEAQLRILYEKNLFIEQLSENHYRYHALFKEFLEKRFKDKRPVEYKQLNERAAKFFEQEGLYENAVFHLEKSGRFDEIAKILQKYGFLLLKEGKLQMLFDKLQNTPTNEKDKNYLLWFFEGEILRLQSKYDRAEQCYDRAILLSIKNNDIQTKSLANEGKGRIYLDTLQPRKAERHLLQAIRERVHGSEFQKEKIATLFLLMIENLINSGKASKAEKWLQRVEKLDIVMDDSNLMARLYLRTGRLHEAKAILKNRKNEDLLNQQGDIPQSHRETDLLLALIESFMGNGEEGKWLSQQSIQHGVRLNSPYIEACGWIRMGHSVQIVSSYDSELAIQCYETALKMMEELKISRGKAEPYMGLSLYYASIEEFERAVEFGNLALQETERVNDKWLSAYIRLSLAVAAAYREKWGSAETQLKETEAYFFDCNDMYGLSLVSFWQSYIAFCQNKWDIFEQESLKLFQRIQYGGFDFLLLKRTLFGPSDIQKMIPMLLEAQKRNIQEPFINRILHERGYSNIDKHPGYTLKVQTLGTCKVFLGNKEVKEKDWQRGKAKELFELFITHNKEVLQKRQIIDLLWPNVDEKIADRDFKVALNALNGALEPKRPARAQSFFIKRIGSGYGLNPHSGCKLDSKLFEEWVLAGLEEKSMSHAKVYLEQGLKLYEGDYLSERRLEDWCINERERLLVIYLRGAEKLAQVSIAGKNYNSAIYWCEKILKKDPIWEEAYRLIMYSYYLKNNRPQSLKWYKKCCEVLREEMGVEPLDATKEMYRIILEAGDVDLL